MWEIFFSDLACFVPVNDLFVLLPGTENICGYMVCGYMLFLPSLFSSALFDLFSRQPRNRLMLFFVDWNLLFYQVFICFYSGLNLAMNGL